MMFAARLIATCFGIGYIQKGAGTVAALFYCLLWWFFRMDTIPAAGQLLIIGFIFFAGIGVSVLVEAAWGKDSNRVVIDELLGMSVALFMVPFAWKWLVLSFLLFRFFDLVKPLYIRKAEQLPSAWGVMTDDLLSGIYTNVFLHLLIKSHLF